MMPKLKPAHENMVKQQIRTWGVTNPVVIDIFEKMPREHFVPSAYQSLAYAEVIIPLAHGEMMLTPGVIGRILQAIHPKGTDKICQIGTGSGYLTALLARMAHYVYSIDIHADLNKMAQQKCSALGITNVNFITANAANGWPAFAPYDVMIFTGGTKQLPVGVKEQMAIGGRIFAVLGRPPAMQAKLLTQVSAQTWITEDLFETNLPLITPLNPLGEFTF